MLENVLDEEKNVELKRDRGRDSKRNRNSNRLMAEENSIAKLVENDSILASPNFCSGCGCSSGSCWWDF